MGGEARLDVVIRIRKREQFPTSEGDFKRAFLPGAGQHRSVAAALQPVHANGRPGPIKLVRGPACKVSAV